MKGFLITCAVILTLLIAFWARADDLTPPIITNYVTVVASDDGGVTLSAPANEVAFVGAARLTWSNAPNQSAFVLTGTSSRHYTRTNAAGLNNWTAYPMPAWTLVPPRSNPPPSDPIVYMLQFTNGDLRISTDLRHWLAPPFYFANATLTKQ